MSSSRLDRGDKTALWIALVMAAMWGAVIFLYMAMLGLAVTRGRPLRKLVHKFRAAVAARVEERRESAGETPLKPDDPGEMLVLYRAEVDSCLAQGDTLTAASYLDMVGYQFPGIEDLDSALHYHRRAIALREDLDIDPVLKAWGYVALAGAFVAVGMQDSALVEHLTIHDLVTASGDEQMTDWSSVWLRGCLEELGEERYVEVCLDAGRDADGASLLLDLARNADEPMTGG